MGEVDLYGKTRDMMKRWMPARYVSFKFNDMKTSGIPDMSLIGNQKVSWWEFKYADPTFEWEGIQHLTCCRLDRESYCRYVVYHRGTKNIYIVKPSDMSLFAANCFEKLAVQGMEHTIPPCGMGGYDHYELVKFMRKVHNL